MVESYDEIVWNTFNVNVLININQTKNWNLKKNHLIDFILHVFCFNDYKFK